MNDDDFKDMTRMFNNLISIVEKLSKTVNDQNHVILMLKTMIEQKNAVATDHEDRILNLERRLEEKKK